MSKQISPLAKKKLVISALEDIKAHDIQAIDVRKLTALFDWIIVASADSARQSKALARHVRDALKESGSSLIGTEGEETGEWVLVDAGDVVAHVMQPAVRSHYNLEELWGEGRFDQVVNSTVPVAKPAKVARVAKPAKTAKVSKGKKAAKGTKVAKGAKVTKPRARTATRRPRAA